MFGIQIFVHAVRMVLSNLGPALRISAVLMAVQFAAAWAFGGGAVVTGGDIGELIRVGAVSAGGALLVLIVTIVTSLWIAVAWHRFILLEETPGGALPAWNGGAIGAYLWAGIIFALILIVVAVPVSLLAGLIVAPLMLADGNPGLIGGTILVLLVYLPMAYVGYRISPILPSAALQKRMPLKDAWYATGTSGAAFIVLTLVSVLASLIIGAPGSWLPGVLGAVWLFAAQWITVLVGASILTTIYGHYVEGRELNG